MACVVDDRVIDQGPRYATEAELLAFSSGIASKPVKIRHLAGSLKAIVEGWLDPRVLMPPVE